MARKMYYTEAEACEKLGISSQELEDRIRDGKLKSFQDGVRRMFKAADIDMAAGGTSMISLSPMVGDEVTLTEASESAGPAKEDTVITAEGISIFDDEDLDIESADPMAKTQIAPSVSEELSIEGGGSSGSGLLDLSRESDDTSLGGVLDEIYSGEETMPDSRVPATAEAAEAAGFEEVEEPVPAAAPAPRVVAATAADPMAGLFSGFLVASLILLGFAGFVAASLTAGVLPGILQTIASNILYPVLGAVLVTVISVVVGFFIGRR